MRTAGPSVAPGAVDTDRGLLRWPAFCWALAFAGIHLHWLGGGRLALPQGVAIEPGSALFVVSLAAVPLLMGAGVLAITGGRKGVPVSTRVSRRVLGLVVLFGVLHAVTALAATLPLQISGELVWTQERIYSLFYEVNWLIGAACFVLAVQALKPPR